MDDSIQDLAARFIQYAKAQDGLRQTPSGFMAWSAYIAQWIHEIKRTSTDGFSSNEEACSLYSALSALCDRDIPPRYVPAGMWTAWAFTKIPPLTWNRPEVLPGYVLFLPIPRTTAEWQNEASAGITYVAAMVLNTPSGLCVHYNPARFADGKIHVMTASIMIAPDDDYNNKGWDPEIRLIASLAINSWLIHAHEPQLIAQETVKSAPGNGFARKSASHSPIAPTWIGRHFKVRREHHAEQPDETGVKVRPHWRSGHWHTVRHGKGREQERLQWYRPVYVNADTAA